MENRLSKFGQSTQPPPPIVDKKSRSSVQQECFEAVWAVHVHSAQALVGLIWLFTEASGRCLQPWMVSGLPLCVLWGGERLSCLQMWPRDGGGSCYPKMLVVSRGGKDSEHSSVHASSVIGVCTSDTGELGLSGS